MPRQKGVKFVEETVISTHFMRMLKMTLIQITQRETALLQLEKRISAILIACDWGKLEKVSSTCSKS
jgi:hypothetical protein